MTTNGSFPIDSMTMPIIIVIVAVTMLEDRGKLQVSDPVSRYLPELVKLQVGVENTANFSVL